MAALAVNQDERLVGPQSAQRCRADHIGTVGDGGLGKVEARQLFVQQPVGLGEAGPRQIVSNDDIDGYGAVRDSAAAAAGAGDHDGDYFFGSVGGFVTAGLSIGRCARHCQERYAGK